MMSFFQAVIVDERGSARVRPTPHNMAQLCKHARGKQSNVRNAVNIFELANVPRNGSGHFRRTNGRGSPVGMAQCRYQNVCPEPGESAGTNGYLQKYPC